MFLSDAAIRNAKPGAKPIKLFDGGGLFLLIMPTGQRWWRLKYRFGGKEKLISLGTFPVVSLKEARKRRESAKALLEQGRDPGHERKMDAMAYTLQDENNFEMVARDWLKKFSAEWSKSHTNKQTALLERDIFPWLKDAAVAKITPRELLLVIQRIEKRGALDTAHRALGLCGQILRYAVAQGKAERDVSLDLRGALPPAPRKHLASITDAKEIGRLLRNMAAYEGEFVTRCALQLAPLVFVRPGELRGALWAEIDLEAKEWKIAAHRMKSRRPHIVPLSRQALEILEEIHPLTKDKKFVFPGARPNGRPMSENTVNAALRLLGYRT